MKYLILHIALFFSLVCFSQNEQLAQYYYEKGDFEKAKISFEELLKATPQNYQYFIRIVDCYQQLQDFSASEKLIKDRLDKYKEGYVLVELGYNFQLQKNEASAKKYYDEAIERIKKNPNEVYGIANSFERKVLLDYALKSYQTALTLDPKFSFKSKINWLVLWSKKAMKISTKPCEKH